MIAYQMTSKDLAEMIKGLDLKREITLRMPLGYFVNLWLALTGISAEIKELDQGRPAFPGDRKELIRQLARMQHELLNVMPELEFKLHVEIEKAEEVEL